MTGRKSQTEKFNARAAKMKADAEAIRTAAMKRSAELDKYEKEGERVMKEAAPTEEVFAVIARSGMESFMKLWNNSMESVIRETVRNEIRPMIQEELKAAMSGMFQGMNEAMTGVIKESIMPVVEEEIVEKVSGPLSQRMKEEVQVEEKPKRKYVAKSRSKIVNWNNAEDVKQYMFTLLDESIANGTDVSTGKAFKEQGGKFNTAYQKGMPAIFGSGLRGKKVGGWSTLLEMYYAR